MNKKKCNSCNGKGYHIIKPCVRFSKRRVDMLISIIKRNGKVDELIEQGIDYGQIAVKMIDLEKAGVLYHGRDMILKVRRKI